MAAPPPTRGTAGSRLAVTTNSFEIRIARDSGLYMHYDVVIEPTLDKSRRAFEIMDKVQLSYPEIFNPRAVYDGRANLFARANIPNGEYEAQMSARPGKGIFKVKLTKVSAINAQSIQRLMAVGGAQQGENLMALNLMQIVVRQASNMRHGFAPDARAFFIERGNKDLSMGLQAWRGYFQSVRPVLGKLLVNVDIVNSLVYRPGELTALAMSFLRLRDIRALERMSPVDLRHLKSFLKNINVTTTTSRVRRGRPIRDLVDNGGGYEFEKDGVRTTVQEHYRQVYNINLRYPAIFGVRIGRDAVIPAELCEVLPGQLYRKKIPAELGADFLKFATQKPDARIQAIQDAVSGRDEVFNYQGSDFVRDAGMRVDPAPLSITGRLLNPPRIQYGSGFEAIQSKRGAWNVVGKKFLTPSTIPTWGVILLDDRADPGRAEHFVGQLKRNLQALGVNVVRDPVLQRGGNAYQVSQALDTLLQRATIVSEPHPRTGQTKPIPPTIIIALLATNAAEIRRAVKHWGDVTRGIPTQCVRSGKWENAKDQYLNNVALKINAKIGGINSRVDDKSLVPPGTMVIGMDVGHPGPGVTARPSVTSLVASVNWDCTQYIAFCGVQPPRVEMIANLKQMLTGAVNQFVLRWEGKYPQKVVFFRDGVSEGEYEQVSQNEIQSIRNVLKDMIKIDPSGVELKSGEKAFGPGMPLPKITFIVVGKRHHVRFFPRNRNEADNSGNCPPGFVIDDQITNAKYPDYYLQSHSGIQGTSRPSHYIVLENELGLPPDTYQRLSFDLCHVYASATRSVSIPAPVYYADRVCARAENHFPDELKFGESDTASTAGGGRAEFDLRPWANGFKQATINMSRQMYYL